MSPSADRVQCPFCLGHLRVKGDGTMYAHDRGRPGMRKRCPGSGKTKEQAKADRTLQDRGIAIPSGQPDEVRPEDIF